MENKIRVAIVDDHAVVREGLRRILAGADEVEVVGEAADGVAALGIVRSRKCDLMLLDVSMPGMNGFDVLHAIRHDGAGISVLMLSMHPEDQFALQALKAGAAGYLNKNTGPSQLLAAIRTVGRGRKYVSAAVAEKLAWDVDSGRARLPHESLADREFEILRFIASGKTVGQIARQLNLSVKTVSTYRARLLQKMNMKTNAELTRYGVEHGVAQ